MSLGVMIVEIIKREVVTWETKLLRAEAREIKEWSYGGTITKNEEVTHSGEGI